MDLDSAQPERFKKLTPEERKRRFDLQLCLYCGNKDHKLAACPTRKAKMNQPGLNMLCVSALGTVDTLSVDSFLRMDDLDVAVRAIVDSGATGNFVSQKFVDSQVLPAVMLPEVLSVRLANGAEVPCGKSLSSTLVGIIGNDQAKLVELDLIIVPDLKYDVVLGLPWLSEANPVIDWSRRVLKFNLNGDLPIEERSSSLGLNNLKVSDIKEKLTLVEPQKDPCSSMKSYMDAYLSAFRISRK
jgi:hypothetical protein